MIRNILTYTDKSVIRRRLLIGRQREILGGKKAAKKCDVFNLTCVLMFEEGKLKKKIQDVVNDNKVGE